jgi:hypothetical protein
MTMCNNHKGLMKFFPLCLNVLVVFFSVFHKIGPHIIGYVFL